MSTLQLLVLLGSVASLTTSAVLGESRCPGNVETIRYHSLGRSKIAIPVSINDSGPYEFIVDTGSQLTIIDPELASALQLQPQASIHMTVVSSMTPAQAQLVIPETVEAASHSVPKPLLAVSRLDQLQAADAKVRGILGENFLARFDLLIDYGHSILCLDEGAQLRQSLQGEHIPLEEQKDRQTDLPFTQPYLISAHLVGMGRRHNLLLLDSGAEVPIIYHDYGDSPSWIPGNGTVQVHSGWGLEWFKFLAPPEDVKIGNTWLRQVVFLMPAGIKRTLVRPRQDGLLPTAVFQRVFLSYSGHFAIFDPK
jgi:Aspartyl protease